MSFEPTVCVPAASAKTSTTTGTAIDFTALQSALTSADLTFNMSLDGVSKEITLEIELIQK